MIGCYCRVSSSRQKTDSQKAEILHWLEGRKIPTAAVQWFEEKGSAKSTERPALQSLQQAVFNGQVNTIVVWKLDRISRRLQDGINLIAGCCDAGVRVVSVTQQIDLSGPAGRTMASVLFGIAEIELEYRRERQAAGISVAKSRGVYKGRKRGTTKANPTRARELVAQGLKVREVASSLGVSERTVLRYLKHEP